MTKRWANVPKGGYCESPQAIDQRLRRTAKSLGYTAKKKNGLWYLYDLSKDLCTDAEGLTIDGAFDWLSQCD